MDDRAPILLLVTILVLVTILLIFGIKSFATARERKLGASDDTLYRELADKAVAASTESAAVLSSLRNSVTEIESRLVSIEKLLKDVQ